MPLNLNHTMGRVIAEAWSDAAFKTRLLAEPKDALAEIDITLPTEPTLIAHESTEQTLHLALSAPPVAVPISALSEIRDFTEVYRDPRLWSLNWIGRDPVAAGRLIADPIGELAKIGVRPLEGLAIVVLANTPSITHLILPPRPRDGHCTPRLLKRLSAGHVPAALRLGRLFGAGPYDALVEALAGAATYSLGESDA